MKQLLPILSFLTLIFSASKCKEDTIVVNQGNGNGTVEMNFTAKINDQPFILNKTYDLNGKKVRFSRFNFFIANIGINAKGSTSTINKLITHIDFKDVVDSSKALTGVTDIITNVSFDNASSIDLGLGVPMDMNKKTPKDYPSSNPLSDPAAYWSDWNSYMFGKFDGLMDTNNDGIFETGFTVETGGNDAYRTVNFSKTLTVNNQKAVVNFELDVTKLFKGVTLSPFAGDPASINVIMDNFKTALTLK